MFQASRTFPVLRVVTSVYLIWKVTQSLSQNRLFILRAKLTKRSNASTKWSFRWAQEESRNDSQTDPKSWEHLATHGVVEGIPGINIICMIVKSVSRTFHCLNARKFPLTTFCFHSFNFSPLTFSVKFSALQYAVLSQSVASLHYFPFQTPNFTKIKSILFIFILIFWAFEPFFVYKSCRPRVTKGNPMHFYWKWIENFTIATKKINETFLSNLN